MPSTLLAGATGLVGRACLDLLLEDDAFERVVVITRRTLEAARSMKLEAHAVDFDHLDDHAALFREDQPGRRIVESAEMRRWAQGPPGAIRVPVS